MSSHIALCVKNARGHINPMLILAKKLAQQGLFVTVIFPDRNSFNSITAEHFHDHNISLTLLEIPGDDGCPPQSPRWVMSGIRRSAYSGEKLRSFAEPTAQQLALETKLAELTTIQFPVTAIVVDMMLAGWSSQIITRFKLPRYVLYTAAATHMALSRYAGTLASQGIIPFDNFHNNYIAQEIQIPGLPPLRYHDLPDYLREKRHPFYCPDWDEQILNADGVLMNTLYEIEGKVMDAIQCEIPGSECLKGKLIPVGPLMSFATKVPEHCKCRRFLDGQPSASVVYVSFGSWALLSDEQIHELAVGLQQSSHRFLWALPHPPDRDLDYFETVLPQDFEERVKDRGMIIRDWAPQQFILGHSAIGGFITHCGWNSVLECIFLAGAPMLGWPFTADQPIICRYLVKELKIAIEIEGEGEIIRWQDVEKAVRRLMSEEAESMRYQAMKLKQTLQSAIATDGSSNKNLKSFAEKINRAKAEIESRPLD